MDTTLIILSLSAFITSAISAVLGMGGGIILLGIMAIMIEDGYMVIALHGVIQLFSNSTRTYLFKDNLKSNIINQFFVGAVIGLIASVVIIMILVELLGVSSADEIKIDFLKGVIGIFILWYLFLKKKNIKKKLETFYAVGGISGLASIFVGATGPLIAPFFLNNKLSKENIIANKAACQVISHIGKIPIFILFFKFNYFDHLGTLIPLFLSVMLGTMMGKQVLHFIPNNIFQILFKIVLTIIAVKLIYENLIIVL